jgi:ABC-type sugar transport system ATPase subunit
VEATIERSDGGVWAAFGSSRLRLRDDVPAAAYDGRQVILGIRPEHLAASITATDAPTDRLIEATIERRELVGAEAFLRFTIDAPLLKTRDPRFDRDVADDADGGGEDGDPWAAERTNAFVARVDPATPGDEGDTIPLIVDVGSVHLFDPSTDRALS